MNPRWNTYVSTSYPWTLTIETDQRNTQAR
jgi:hypothetical protein